MLLNCKLTNTFVVYTVDACQVLLKQHAYQVFGAIVLDLGENTLLRYFIESTRLVGLNLSLKAALYFYVFMSKKVFVNSRANKTVPHYCFKIRLANFKTLCLFYATLFAEYKSIFTTSRAQSVRNVGRQKVYFFRIAQLLSGAALNDNSELFKYLYKDIRPKTFFFSAKFLKTLLLV